MIAEDSRRYTTKVRIQVKLEESGCNLNEPQRHALALHAARLLYDRLKDEIKSTGPVEGKYLTAGVESIRVKDWNILDLRPDNLPDDAQRALDLGKPRDPDAPVPPMAKTKGGKKKGRSGPPRGKTR